METRLGAELFQRNKKRVALTPAGYFLNERLDHLFKDIGDIKKGLRSIAAADVGELRIGFLGSAMQNVIPDFLYRLKEGYPRINTVLEECSNKEQLKAVQDGTLDIGFVRLDDVPAHLGMKKVYEDTFSLVLPESYPMLTREYDGMARFADDDFILFPKEYSPHYFKTVMDICSHAASAKIAHTSIHSQTIFKLVESRMGIAIVPTALRAGFQLRVKSIELKDIPQRAHLSAIWKKNPANPVLKNCLDLLFDVS